MGRLFSSTPKKEGSKSVPIDVGIISTSLLILLNIADTEFVVPKSIPNTGEYELIISSLAWVNKRIKSSSVPENNFEILLCITFI